MGAGIRFNFGREPFSKISWTEWFDHFNRHDLTFVFDNPAMEDAAECRYRLMRTGDLLEAVTGVRP